MPAPVAARRRAALGGGLLAALSPTHNRVSSPSRPRRANPGPAMRRRLLVLLCLWNTMKLVVMGPVSVILLARVRVREAVARRANRTTGFRL